MDQAIELDLLNVLPDELDPKVTYREAVRLREADLEEAVMADPASSGSAKS